MKRVMVVALIATLVGVGLLKQTPPPTAEAATQDVILLYGWNGSTANWSTAAPLYAAQGYRVHALALPRAGWNAGDTAANAQAVAAYIAAQGLTDVKLDGHSLGGWLALYVTLVDRNPAVTSVVMRDTGTGCYFGIPGDQCPGATMLTRIRSAAPSSVPVLLLKNTQSTGADAYADCVRTAGLDHNAFLTDAAINAAAIAWGPAATCGSTSPPTATASATPSVTPSPTVTATATRTATPVPTATSTPRPRTCWFGFCW